MWIQFLKMRESRHTISIHNDLWAKIIIFFSVLISIVQIRLLPFSFCVAFRWLRCLTIHSMANRKENYPLHYIFKNEEKKGKKENAIKWHVRILTNNLLMLLTEASFIKHISCKWLHPNPLVHCSELWIATACNDAVTSHIHSQFIMFCVKVSMVALFFVFATLNDEWKECTNVSSCVVCSPNVD